MPRVRFALPLALLLGVSSLPATSSEGPYVLYRSTAPFPDVLQALKLAIEEKGLYINNIMHMGEMLERTGKDLGQEKTLYLRAETIEFCSALLSRRMAAENPARIINCPYLISVYVLPQEPDTTYITHRRVNLGDDSPVMGEVEAMLESLADAAVGGF